MKSTQKVTRLKLDIEQNNEYILIGLVSAEPDYKVSLAINKKFNVSLKNTIPLLLTGENNSEITFSRFSNHGGTSDLVLSLTSNRSGKNYLLGKLKNVDYLLQICDPDKEVNVLSHISELRDIEAVTAVFNIDLNTLKDKNLHYLTQ
jgi:hypothetical protein